MHQAGLPNWKNAQLWNLFTMGRSKNWLNSTSISGLVAEYIVAIDVTRFRFPADAFCGLGSQVGFAGKLACARQSAIAIKQAVIAQLAARRSHNPKVVSLILTHRILSRAFRRHQVT